MNEIIELLNDDKITAKMFEYFFDNEYEFNPKWRNQNKYVSYLKAYYVDRYNTVSDDVKEMMIKELKEGQVNFGILMSFTDVINGSEAKQNDSICGVNIIEFKDLLSYKDDYIYEELSQDNDWIAGLIRERTGLITMKELKKGDYIIEDGYVISKDEIKTLENAKLVRGYINVIHSIYDELSDSFDERTVCNYNAIEDENLRKLAFHTDKKNPEYEFLFDDGTMANYYMGDIRFFPISFNQLVEYVKLTFVDNYYNGEDNTYFQMLLEPYDIDPEEEFEEMDEETLEALIYVATEMAYDAIYSLVQIYSKRMIEKSKKDVEKMKTLVKKYKL